MMPLLLLGAASLIACALLGTMVEAEDTLDFDNLDMWASQYWHPNQTKVLHFYVRNSGSMTDTYDLSLVISDPNWTGRLDAYLFPDVPPGNSRYFNLTLTAPPAPVAGSYTKVNITASSRGAPISRHLEFRAFIIIERKFHVTCREATKAVSPVGAETFELHVENDGDLPDSYGVEVTIESEHHGWSVSVSPTEFELDVGEELVIEVEVVPTGEAPNLIMFIKVISTNDSSVWDTKRLVAVIGPFMEADLQPSQGTWEVLPGSVTSLDLRLEQWTNTESTVEWSVRIDGFSIQWDLHQEQESYILKGKAWVTIRIDVTAPPEAAPMTSTYLRVYVTCVEWPEEVLVALYQFTVQRHIELDLSLAWSTPAIEPGSDVGLPLEVWNRGNTYQSFIVTGILSGQRLPPSMLALTSIQGGVTPYTKVTVSMRILVGRNCPRGVWPLEFYLVVGGETLALALGQVEVLELPSIRVVSDHDGQHMVRLDSNLHHDGIEYTVWNDGNVPVQVVLGSHLEPPSTEVRVEVMDLAQGLRQWLAVSRELHFTVVLDASQFRGEGPDEGFVKLTIDLGQTTGYWNDTLRFQVTAPDLRLEGVMPPVGVRRGESAELRAIVSNGGTGASPETTLVVLWACDREPVSGIAVPALEPGEYMAFSLALDTWRDGEPLLIVIDPHGEVLEPDESNNELPFEVEGVPTRAEPESRVDPFFVLALVAASILLIASICLKRGLYKG